MINRVTQWYDRATNTVYFEHFYIFFPNCTKTHCTELHKTSFAHLRRWAFILHGLLLTEAKQRLHWAVAPVMVKESRTGSFGLPPLLDIVMKL